MKNGEKFNQYKWETKKIIFKAFYWHEWKKKYKIEECYKMYTKKSDDQNYSSPSRIIFTSSSHMIWASLSHP